MRPTSKDQEVQERRSRTAIEIDADSSLASIHPDGKPVSEELSEDDSEGSTSSWSNLRKDLGMDELDPEMAADRRGREDGEAARRSEQQERKWWEDDEEEERGLEQWRQQNVEEERAAEAAARAANGMASDEEEEEEDVLEVPKQVEEEEEDEIVEVEAAPQDADRLEVPADEDEPVIEVYDVDSTLIGADNGDDTVTGVVEEEEDPLASFLAEDNDLTIPSYPSLSDMPSPSLQPEPAAETQAQTSSFNILEDDSFGLLPNTPLSGAASGPGSGIGGAGAGAGVVAGADADTQPLTEEEIEEFLRIYAEAKAAEDEMPTGEDNTPAFFEGSTSVSGEGEGDGVGAALRMEDMVDVGATADFVDQDQREDSIASSREGSVHPEEQVEYIVEEDEAQPQEEVAGQDEADEFLEGDESLLPTSSQAYEVEEERTEGRLTQVCFLHPLATSS